VAVTNRRDESNGFPRNFEQSVEALRHFLKVEELHLRLDEIEGRPEYARSISFWHIPEKENQHAQKYAAEAMSCAHGTIGHPIIRPHLPPWIPGSNAAETVTQDAVSGGPSATTTETAQPPDDKPDTSVPDCWPTARRRSPPGDASMNCETRALLTALVKLKFKES
jgi:hypothetical protein